ncbi:LRP5_6 [Mytilus coruscus]|uniref:LRP5_6 n=1 Tax=Mytilus coruscus TaxID=42192 RepID=A0A6J8DXF5_MYTCO|nr:LRP5_6 [Mytilus coruscus]
MLNEWIVQVQVIEDDNPWVMHTNKLTIDRLELETWTNTSVVRGMVAAVSVDYHFTKGFIYYSDQKADRVSRWMFFTDVEYPNIEKCGLDESNRQAIVTTNIGSPNGLSIDFTTNRLYWVDNHILLKQIKSSKLDGTDIKIVMQSADNLPWVWGLVVYTHWLYLTQFSNNSVCRVDKQTGSNFQIIRADADQPVGIKIYSEDNQPKGTNLCFSNNGGCEQLCLPTPQYTVICTCADGFELKPDEKTCLYKGSGKWVTFANLNTIERMDLETNVTETIASKTNNAVDLDIHYEKGFVYWSDVRAKKISRSTVTRTSVSGYVEDIIVETVDVPDGIAIDWVYNLLYWTDTGHSHIQVSRLDGTDSKTIIENDGSLEEPRAIVVDPNTGLLFFTDWGSSSRIERCGMDGRDRRIIINSDITWPNGMTIDGSLNQIKSTRFDGTDTYTVIKNENVLPKPFDLVVYGSYVYWSNEEYRSVCRVNKNTGRDFSILANYLRSPMGIQVFADGVQPKEPPKYIIIDVRSTSVIVTWNFPVTLEYIVQTELKLYDNDDSIVYTRSSYYPVAEHTITAIQLQKCHRYRIKLRCQYIKHGWSPDVEHKFWATENMVYSEQSKNINITWTSQTYRSSVDVIFDSLVDTQKTIFANDIPIDNSQKYKYLNKDGLNFQFTLQDVLISDVGLYKSAPVFDSTLIDGCALLVITELPQTPYLTYDKQHFVGSTSVFKCSSAVTRHPMYLPSNLQYTWSVVGIKQGDTLSINTITKSDKGKDVACTVTDDRGKVSASSNTVSLDPYYGPESIRLSTDSESVNVAKGSRLTVTCFAICYPKCYFVWKRVSNGVISDMSNDQTFTINDVSLKDDGISNADEVTQIPDKDFNAKSRKTDNGVTSKEIIIYPIIGVAVVIIGTVVLLLICWRRRRNSPARTGKPFEEPDKRVSTVSAIYDTIDEQREHTSNMYNPNSEYLDPFHELASSRTDPKYVLVILCACTEIRL